MSIKLLLDVCYHAQVAPSGECLWGEGLVRLIAAAYGSFACAKLCCCTWPLAGTGCAVPLGSLLYVR